jgi:hypothetical protein
MLPPSISEFTKPARTLEHGAPDDWLIEGKLAKMKILVLAATTVAVLAATMSASEAGQWTKIGPGPTYDYAEAYCNLAAMGSQPGHFVMGSPGFVAGAAIGAAIGGAIRNAIFKQNCMVLQGWKWMDVAAAPGKPGVRVHAAKLRN